MVLLFVLRRVTNAEETQFSKNLNIVKKRYCITIVYLYKSSTECTSWFLKTVSQLVDSLNYNFVAEGSLRRFFSDNLELMSLCTIFKALV